MWLELTFIVLVPASAFPSGSSSHHSHGHTTPSAIVNFSYPGGVMRVALVGEGDVARVTYVPTGANASFLRYQGYINTSALSSEQGFALSKTAAGSTVLARPGWSLTVGRDTPTASLSIGGVVVSRDLHPPKRVLGAACDPPGWKGLLLFHPQFCSISPLFFFAGVGVQPDHF
jgi:hypothetical protein